jgi:hypothetical protein
MNYSWLVLAIPAFGAGFVALWCAVLWLVAQLGWRRLAADYQVASLPEGPHFLLRKAYLGPIGYGSALQAGATAAGLALRTVFPFRTGHPPLLIPWAAVGPLRAEKFLWATFYTTTLRTGNQDFITLKFIGSTLAEAARPWVQTE